MASRNNWHTIPEPCTHLADFKLKHGASGYNLIREYVRTNPYGRVTIDESKIGMHRCNFFHGHLGRPYLCMICWSVSCGLAPESNHALLHSQSSCGHEIAVDMERAELYCCVCSDQVYDPDFDKATLWKHMARLSGTENEELRMTKRKRLNFGLDLDLTSVKRLVSFRDQKSKSYLPVGLRGLNNLGNTCFMNSVLQALLHAPPLRNYFLSDIHSREMCRKRSADRLCLPCDLHAMFSAVFSGDQTPFSPAQFLYSWWQYSENLASYEQQDAHEFFISMMDRIHEKEGQVNHDIRGNLKCRFGFSSSLNAEAICLQLARVMHVCMPVRDNKGLSNLAYKSLESFETVVIVSEDNLVQSHNRLMILLRLKIVDIREPFSCSFSSSLMRDYLFSTDNGDCQCIAHRSFAGLLRSDVTCTSCGYISSTYDPCIDISLDLGASTSYAVDAGKPGKPNETTSTSTLLDCLDLFTNPEKLGPDQKLYCENCQEKQDALKQMSIKKLPLVLCLHIKRFEHSAIKRLSRKIDRHLQFPFTLDMKPYLSSSILKKRFGNRMFSFDGDESDVTSKFEVFAIVTHSGMLESGHYLTYLRLRNRWFKCDDAWITEVDEEVVRASQCYLIYYVQKVLLHKGGEELSCQPISSRADSFVPIAGCC